MNSEQGRRVEEIQQAAWALVSEKMELEKLVSELESLQVKVTQAKARVLLAAANHKDLVEALIRDLA